jgi:hypothetical protein
MIAVIWGIGATAVGIAACIGWWRASLRYDHVNRLRHEWIDACKAWKHRALTAEDALSVIRFKRHRSASHARNCQVQQQRALVRHVAEKMRAEIGR